MKKIALVLVVMVCILVGSFGGCLIGALSFIPFSGQSYGELIMPYAMLVGIVLGGALAGWGGVRLFREKRPPDD